ncbi:hypothetical protein ACJIZ3_021736 [Penstemon smallii]|uniref:Uncharacterized protein n=1 Tax=Penstemon smallii TaxID=265156 RepID=A0ABD3SM98_9LAMI
MASTFTRFFPDVKSRYDYGVLIFILTFSLVAVSGFRVTQIIQLARQRVATILIGGAVCMIISVFICPVWAGQDLHNLLAANIEKLAVFLDGYKSVLNSRMIEESLLQVASEFHRKIQKPCTTLSTESSKALRELSHSLKNMRFPSSAVQIHIRNSKAAADYLKTTLENSSLPHKQNLQEIMQLIVISSVLTDIIKCVEEISVSVHELSRMARFRDQKSTSTLDKEQKLFRRGNVNVADDIGDGAYSKDTSGKNILLPLEREQQLRVYIE